MYRRLFLVLYLLSGAAALLYEVVWVRLLTLSMGHTSRSVGIVLAAFMGGLAAGAWGAGRIAPSLMPARALRLYAGLEAFIAACALLLPVLFAQVRPLLPPVYADGAAGPAFALTIALISFLLLTVPTIAMGATYPIAVRWIQDEVRSNRSDRSTRSERSRSVFQRSNDEPRRQVTSDAGSLYAMNTLGAAIGAAAAGFLLLPAIGMSGTTWVGVALNGIAAAGALLLLRVQPASPLSAHSRTVEPSHRRTLEPANPRTVESANRRTVEPPHRRTLAPSHPRTFEPSHLSVAAFALGVSGMISLVYQVSWTRTLAMVLGPTTYAFSAMLVAVITGLAIGSSVAAARAPGSPARAAVCLGYSMIGAAAAAIAASFAVDRLPLVIASVVSGPDVSFDSVLALQVALAVAMQLPMTIAFGAAFPLAIAAAGLEPDTAPRGVARIYATNTVGAIVGAIAASFVLIPALGIQTTMRLAALTAVAAGAAVVWRLGAGTRDRTGVALTATAALVFALVTPQWNQARLANGAYRYATTLAAGDVETGLEAGRLLYYREGAAGTVSVREVPGARSMAIDGKVDASNAGDMLTQKLLAHLPLLMHPDPRRVAVIGLGSGVTLGAALTHPVEQVDVIEISPEVVEASAFFVRENRHALRDPRIRLIVGDGRSHLLLSRSRYDVIISEPSNPWMAGVASLFTREFFLAARARLTPGGLFMQWAHTYSISGADLRSIVATFLSVFPDATAWLVGESDLLLVGATGPVEALEAGWASAWARSGVAADLAGVTIRDPFSVLSLYLAGGADLRRYAAGAAIQSDDLLRLEYTGPRALYGSFQQANVERLGDVGRRASLPSAVAHARSDPTASELRNRGLMLLQAGAVDRGYADLLAAVMASPADAEALHGVARAAARLGRLDEAERVLADIAYGQDRSASGTSRNVPALVELSFVRAVLGRPDQAVAAARDGVLVDPSNAAALRQLASVYADNGNEEGLERLIEVVEQSTSDKAVLLYCQTRLMYVRGEFDRAVQLGEEHAALEPSNVGVYNLLGSAYAALAQYDRARLALEASLRLAPTDPGVLVNLGTVALRSGDAVTAEERFSEALFLSPTLPAALNGLADALEQQGDSARAAEIRERVRSPQ